MFPLGELAVSRSTFIIIIIIIKYHIQFRTKKNMEEVAVWFQK